MRLTKVKIVGFKSFVDPTTILLPSALVAIVGPNGCGKSNIIDAILWVMGESSPKYLRGALLTDVIFNGSTARKPIGQASVELVFDNQEGLLGGDEYSKFAEISIKRSINRAADAGYYLNGVRCRKRDIIDIFLGTGLGPRSYSIIGQNMINRVIEAKPDELRAYLEEAAGISKYKERRHETERRMQHTKENLERVHDIQNELEKQLMSLQRQAAVAEKFKMLKKQEACLYVEREAMKWRALEEQTQESALHIQQEETALEQKQSEMSQIEHDLLAIEGEAEKVTSVLQSCQDRYYAHRTEINRLEQSIAHHKQHQQQLAYEQQQIASDQARMLQQSQDNQTHLETLSKEIEMLQPILSENDNALSTLQTTLNQLEEYFHACQNEVDVEKNTLAQKMQIVNVEQARIEHLTKQGQIFKARQTQCQHDEAQWNIAPLQAAVEDYVKQIEEKETTYSVKSEECVKLKESLAIAKVKYRETGTVLSDVRMMMQRLHGQRASLEALQQNAFGRRDQEKNAWMKKHQLDHYLCLAQYLRVETGWELAVEKILQFCLQAICVDAWDERLEEWIQNSPINNICLFAPRAAGKFCVSEEHHPAVLLLERIESPWPLEAFLSGIYTADSLKEARALAAQLTVNESVVTKEGLWLGQCWIKILHEENSASGCLQREQELKQFIEQESKLKREEDTLKCLQATQDSEIQALIRQNEQLEKICRQEHALLTEYRLQKKMKEARIEELQVQFVRVKKELEECSKQLSQTEIELKAAHQTWQSTTAAIKEEELKYSILLEKKEAAQQQLNALRKTIEEKKEERHRVAMGLQTLCSKRGAQQEEEKRLQAQGAILEERATLNQRAFEAIPVIETLQQALSHALTAHIQIEAEVQSVRACADELEQRRQCLSKARQLNEQAIFNVRVRLEGLRVEYAEQRVKQESIIEHVKEKGYELKDVLSTLPKEAVLSEWQVALDKVIYRISRLGAINLMAIDEYQAALERKTYLDKQMNDLQAGLTMLQDAMHQIDQETKITFKETLQQINAHFQALFPTIFDGGHASLELTHENLLEAGVTIMACPPGKRNASIYLLSGGEKALTALAFIFSIFRLNPAPFCLLDEVDAALDDANVVRFTHLVKKMAEKTQFLFISHNKISIEMGDHLIGVTMSEPGVSRLVSVDMKRALALIEA